MLNRPEQFQAKKLQDENDQAQWAIDTPVVEPDPITSPQDEEPEGE